MVYDHSVKFGGVWYEPGKEVPDAPEPDAPVEEKTPVEKPQDSPRGRRGKKEEPEHAIELEV